MLTEKQYEQIRKELDECANPLFFFHDDADGLASFLLLYRYCREGRGIAVKSKPIVDMKFFRKVEEFRPDKVFILDVAIVDQEFIDACKVPVIWIDHHQPLERNNVKYFNPRKENKDDNQPASYLCYNVVKQDLWIAMVGCVGDWYMPDFAPEFVKEYPDFLDIKITDPEIALFETKLGELIKFISFLLKGKTSDVNKAVKILTRIKDANELFNIDVASTKYLMKQVAPVQKNYSALFKSAMKIKCEEGLYIFQYNDDKMSLTKELSNELLHRIDCGIILICREKSGEMKCSLRTKKHILPPIIQEALIGLEGYGGGHEHACGSVVKKEDFEQFLKRLREQIN